MKFKSIFVSAFIALVAALPASAQINASSADIEAAKAVARSYGYTNDEINSVLVRNMNGQIVNQSVAAGTVAIPPVSDTRVQVQDIPQPTRITPIEGRKAPSSQIYGHDFFISDGLSLIPSINAPLPDSYVLGPGDYLSISITGDSNAEFACQVSNDGSISLRNVGVVYVGGKTLADAEKALKQKLSASYSSIRSGGSSLHLTISRIRGVTVYVLGEVYTPGVYTLPSLTSIATAIYMAGGIQNYGSVRDISLWRGGELAGKFDLYNFIFNGNYGSNLRLQDGDVISVGAKRNLVKTGGGLNRHFRYEMLEGETLADLIRYAGGFSTEALRTKVHIDRLGEHSGISFDVEEADFHNFKIQAGDSLYVYTASRTFENRVYIGGNVTRPGPYSISPELTDLRQLIEAAGGLKEGTYMDKGHLRRFDDDYSRRSVTFSPREIMSGKSRIDLVREDSIRIYSVMELTDTVNVTISGSIKRPGRYDYRKGLTLGTLILESGGLREGADLANVEIASRGNVGTDAESRTYNLIENPSAIDTELNPYDLISIRTVSNFRPLLTVEVLGEVNYPGAYAIENNSVRLSEIISRAGGFTEYAYTKGATLRRKMSGLEIERNDIAKDIAMGQKMMVSASDTISEGSPNIRRSDTLSVYTVAIDLQASLANPGSYSDVVLRDGDVIEVPQLNNTVKISGAVYQPNTVSYNPSFGWKQYINQAGGFVKGALKNRTYAIYMDGSSAVCGSREFRMEPGMELVVPQRNEDGRRISTAEIAAIVSSVSSLAYIGAILINLLKK